MSLQLIKVRFTPSQIQIHPFLIRGVAACLPHSFWNNLEVNFHHTVHFHSLDPHKESTEAGDIPGDQLQLQLKRAWTHNSHFPVPCRACMHHAFLCKCVHMGRGRVKVLKSVLQHSQESKIHGARQTLNQSDCVICWAIHSPGKQKQKLLIWISHLLPQPFILNGAVAVVLHIGYNIAYGSGSLGSTTCLLL